MKKEQHYTNEELKIIYVNAVWIKDNQREDDIIKFNIQWLETIKNLCKQAIQPEETQGNKDNYKSYKIEHYYEKNGHLTEERNNDGFNAFELYALLDIIKKDIKKQIKGKVRPNIIKRNYIQRDEKEQ